MHIKRVFSQRPSRVSVSSEGSQSSVDDCSVLSVPVDKCEITNVSHSTLRNIWSKAENLIKSDGHIIKVPWLCDDMARLIKSTISQQPHLVTRNPKRMNIFCCDKNCQMFKGFSICSHVVATAQVNGQLESYLTEISGICKPNFTVISSQKMPSGTGRKGDVCKRKCNYNHPAIETQSLRPCLESSHSAVQTSFETLLPRSSCYGDTSSTSSATPSLSCVVNNPTVTIVDSIQNQTTIGTSAFSDSLRDNTSAMPVTPSLSCMVSNSTINISDSTLNQIAVGISFCVSPAVATPLCTSSGNSTSTSNSLVGTNMATKKPFVLKLKTNQIKVCQSCRKNYDGPNDTLGLVVAHAERRLICNLATGAQFLGKESNSHYHLHLSCLRGADMSFTARDLMVPDDIKNALSAVQKMYLTACFDIVIL